jgi:hypothetical protein
VLSPAGRGVAQVEAHGRCVLVQCTIHKNRHIKNSITRLFLSTACTPVLSPAGRGVVQAAAHERCVLVQCTIHKNLRFKNSITRLFLSTAGKPVLSAAGRGVVQAAAHERCALAQCTIHKNLRFKNSITRWFCVGSWSWAAPEVTFGSGSYIASPASVDGQHSTCTLVLSAAGRGVVQAAAHERCVLVQCTIHENLRFKNSVTLSTSGVSIDSWHTRAFTSRPRRGPGRSAWALRPGTVHHPQKPALQEFNHSVVSTSEALMLQKRLGLYLSASIVLIGAPLFSYWSYEPAASTPTRIC